MARLLILEDDTALSRKMTESLTDAGHDVVEFDKLGPAIKHIENLPVDLLIVDLFIRDRKGALVFGGISLISQARQIMRMQLPILAISGSFSTDIHLEAVQTSMSVGASATLAKPFHPDQLIELTNELLEAAERP